MRLFVACLSLLGLSACDTIWAWTARCEANDPACTTSAADMSVNPMLEDLAGVDLVGVDQATTDLAVQGDAEMGPPPIDMRPPNDQGGDLSTSMADLDRTTIDGSAMTLDLGVARR